MLRLKSSVAIALFAVAAGLFTQPSQAGPRVPQGERERQRTGQREGRTAPPGEVRGTLKSVDPDKGTITVSVMEGRADVGEKTFTLAKNVEVGVSAAGGGRRGGALREGKLADLAAGVQVVLQLNDDQSTVQCVLAEGPTVQGIIKAIDAEKGILTLSTAGTRGGRGEPPAEPQDRSFTLAKNVEIALDDGRGKTFSVKEAKLADLPVGAHAMVKLSTDLKHVLFVQAEGGSASGVVKAVDAGKRQIQLITRGAGRGDDTGEERTIMVGPTADILVDEGKSRRFGLKEGKLEDIHAGALATVKFAPDQQTATVVEVQGPSVHGAVKAVDAGKGVITLITRAGRGDTPAEEKSYSVAKDARITIEGKAAKLADVKVDENGPGVGLRLSLDQKTVTGITVGGPGRR